MCSATIACHFHDMQRAEERYIVNTLRLSKLLLVSIYFTDSILCISTKLDGD